MNIFKVFKAVGKEFWLAAGIIFFTVIFFNLNFLLSYFFYKPGFEFTGVIGISKIDYMIYFSMIEHIKQGAWLAQNLYTTEALSGGLFHPLWLLLGKLAAVFKMTSIEIYHWSKIYFGIIFMFFLYFLSRSFFSKTVWKLSTLVAFGFAAGWGRWFSLLINDSHYQGGEVLRFLYGIDMWHSDVFVYLTLTQSSLLILSQLLLVCSWWFLVYEKETFHLFSGIFLLFLGIIHPYDIVVFWPVVIIWVLLIYIYKPLQLRDFLKRLMPAIGATLAVMIYYLFVIFTNPSIAGWFNQNITRSPGFYSVLIGYGWLWLFSGYALFQFFKNAARLDSKYYWLAASFLTLPLLLYAPVNFSRRLMAGFGVVIVIMSVIGFQKIWTDKIIFYLKKVPLSAAIFIVSFFLLTLLLGPVHQGVENALVVTRGEWLAFLPASQIDIARQISLTKKDAIILANYSLAHIIPAYSGRYVYIGHPHQTVNFNYKYDQSLRFFGPSKKDWPWREEFLRFAQIDYFVWPAARAEEVPPHWPVYYRNHSHVVYQVK